MTPRPVPLVVRPKTIPAAFKADPIWACWRYEFDQKANGAGRWVKIPVQPSGAYAKSNDAATWTTFDKALAARGFDGVGIFGWTYIDLDRCIPATEFVGGYLTALDRVGAYRELSPSGTGYKAFGCSTRFGGEIKFQSTPPVTTPWHRPRFAVVTGHGVGDPTVDLTPLIDAWFPAPIAVIAAVSRPSFIKAGDRRGTEQIDRLTDDEVVDRILVSPQADKFCALMRGDIAAYGNDRSRADQALVCILIYWSGDLDQVDRLFRKSKLMRDKWNVSSYRRATLAKAQQLLAVSS